jgi:hypothetical protein
MKTPSLPMITAGCFGPGICRTRAIWCFEDVNRTTTARARMKHIWPAIGSAVGAACKPGLGLRSLALSTGFALLAFVRGLVANLRRGVSQNSLQGVTSSATIGTDLTGLRRCDLHSRKWTPEPEPTQTDVTDQHG